MSTRPRHADKVNLSLQPQQALAFTCPANEILYGGAAGGGKSHLMRVDAIYWCRRVPGLQAYIFRRNYPDLRLNHMQGPTSFPELLAPLVNAGRCRIVGEEIRFFHGPDENGDPQAPSVIHLCHLQYTKSLQKYQGAEIHWLGIDELTHFEGKQYRYLRGRVRLGSLKVPPGLRGVLPRIVCGTNPGGVGHFWVKDTFIRLGPMRVVKMPAKEGGMRRVFIPARLEDNPALMKNDPDYEDRLEALGDPLLVRAMREGDWDVVAGAMYGASFRKSTHTCEAFAIPHDWKVWRGADDGYGAPAACYWLAENPKTKTIYVVDELYRTGMLPEEYAERVLEKDRALERCDDYGNVSFNTEQLDGLMDSGAWAKTGETKTPRGPQIVAAGARFRPVEKWPGSRIHRVQELHRRLGVNKSDPEGRPGIIFFTRCRMAIETIPSLPRDENNVEDIDTDANDHAFDGVTYGLQWRSKRVVKMKFGGM